MSKPPNYAMQRPLDIMRRLLEKVLIAIEVMICFGPAAILWCLGLMFAPLWVLSGSEPDLEAIAILAMVVGGAFGIVSLLAVLDGLVAQRPPKLSTRVTIVFSVVGAAALLPLVFGFFPFPGARVIGLLPIIGMLNLLYLSRVTMFPRPPPPVEASL